MTATRDTLRLARLMSPRRFRERPLRSALTAAGVAAGVALLFSISLLNAELTDSVRQTGALLTGAGLVQVSAASPGGLPEASASQVAVDPRVAAVAPMTLDRTTVTARGHKTGTFVVGATPGIAAVAPDIVRGVKISGAVLGGGMVVSRGLASDLGVKVGDHVGMATPEGVADVRVGAVVSSPLLSHVNAGMAAFLPLADAQRLFGRAARVDQIM
ncbi:MAG: ABC transporter permease, partial [Actinobacteria bacterium]|nr:ABC transporter permease [Actinomycetota bacterium]